MSIIKHLYYKITTTKNFIVTNGKTTLRCLKMFGFRKTVPMIVTRIIHILRPPKTFLSKKLLESPQQTNYYQKLTVSVIIPVKNAGEDLREILSLLQLQQGLKNLEIIVVDSGSTDSSLSIAQQYATKVIPILPEEFSHSHARNLGAEQAQGDYLLFMVQDAFPDGVLWIYRLLCIMLQQNAVAISCAESPRSNADLFYKAQSWHHYNWLLGGKGDRIMTMPRITNYESIRRNASLSNICNLVVKDVFLQHKFQGNFAEDLEFGIRLIKNKYRLVMVSSVKVIHSHNRHAYYYFKRGYADKRSLLQMFPDSFLFSRELLQLYSEIIICYVQIVQLCDVVEQLKQVSCSKAYQVLTKSLQKNLSNKNLLPKTSVADNLHKTNIYIDPEWHQFLQRIYENYNEESAAKKLIAETIVHFTWILFEYFHEIGKQQLDTNTIEAIKSYFFKAHALISGAHLADCIVHCDKSDAINALHNELVRSV